MLLNALENYDFNTINTNNMLELAHLVTSSKKKKIQEKNPPS